MELFECKRCGSVYDAKKSKCPDCGNRDFKTIEADRGVVIEESEQDTFGKFIDWCLKMGYEE